MAKILLVEDEVLTRRVLVRALERTHEVRTADSVRSAAEVCDTFLPDVAILDWLVKGEGRGLDIARQLTSESPDTRIIVISGLPEELIREELGDVPVSAVMTKPVTLAEVRSAVDEALG